MRNACLSFSLFLTAAAASQFAGASDVEAAFSPAGNAHALVIRTIRAARLEIDFAAFEFTSATVAAELVAASQRGVRVFAVLDAGENEGKGYSKMYTLQHAGIAVRLDRQYKVMHDKFMVVDGQTVETGSFNFTAAAERRNAENVVVITSSAIGGQFRAEFARLWAESE